MQSDIGCYSKYSDDYDARLQITPVWLSLAGPAWLHKITITGKLIMKWS